MKNKSMNEGFLRLHYPILSSGYAPDGGDWLLQIMTRLGKSSSQVLRDRMNNWEKTILSDLGENLFIKLIMIEKTIQRFDLNIQRLGSQLNNKDSINRCLIKNLVYPIRENLLAYELSIDFDSFLFETRSAYELCRDFLIKFFKLILGLDLKIDELIKELNARSIDSRWIKDLQKNRNLFIHNAVPRIIVDISSIEPLKFDLVILKRFVKNFKNPNDYLHFNQIREIYSGFRSSMSALHTFIFDKIEEFEEKNAI